MFIFSPFWKCVCVCVCVCWQSDKLHQEFILHLFTQWHNAVVCCVLDSYPERNDPRHISDKSRYNWMKINRPEKLWRILSRIFANTFPALIFLKFHFNLLNNSDNTNYTGIEAEYNEIITLCKHTRVYTHTHLPSWTTTCQNHNIFLSEIFPFIYCRNHLVKKWNSAVNPNTSRSFGSNNLF